MSITPDVLRRLLELQEEIDSLVSGALLLTSTAPQPVGTQTLGTDAKAAHGDHVHAHGNQSGGSLHANAVASTSAGFLSGADKAKLDGVAAGATADAPYTSTPAAVAAAGSAGSSGLWAKGDHAHAHGNQAGGSLHSDVVAAGASGFMSGSDKTKLNGVASGATADAPYTSTPADVAAAGAAGSSALWAKGDHAHGHGNQAGGALHADVVAAGASGFMSGSDKTKLNGIAAAATAEVDAAHSQAGRVNLSAQKLGDGTKEVDAILLDTGTPNAPAAGKVIMHAGGIADLPYFRTNGSKAKPILSHFPGTFSYMGPSLATGNSMTVAAISGTLNNGGGAPTIATTNILTQAGRSRNNSAASSASSVGATLNGPGVNSPTYWLGNAAGLGGFRMMFRFGFFTIPATRRWAVGLKPSGGDPSSNANPSAAVNWIGFGQDTGDSTIQMMHNDGTGTATKHDSTLTGVTTTELYEFWLYSAPNSGSVSFSVESLNGGGGPFTYTYSSTDLPANTTFLQPFIWANNATTAAAITFDWVGWVAERDF